MWSDWYFMIVRIIVAWAEFFLDAHALADWPQKWCGVVLFFCIYFR